MLDLGQNLVRYAVITTIIKHKVISGLADLKLLCIFFGNLLLKYHCVIYVISKYYISLDLRH